MATKLELIDGGLSRSNTIGIAFAGVGNPSIIDAIQRLLTGAIDENAAAIRLDPAPLPVEVTVAASTNPFCFSLRRVEGSSPSRSAQADAQRRQPPVSTSVVMSLKGTVASVSPSINLRIIASPDPERSAPAEILRLARSEGRDCAVLIRPDRGTRVDDLAPATRMGGVNIDALEAIELADAAAMLVRRAFPYNVALASSRDAEVLASIAHELAGDRWIATRVDYCDEVISSRAFAISDKMSGSSIGAEAMISAAAEIIAAGGLPKAAAKIRNALLSALEDNLHTSAAPLIAPYTRRLSDLDFIHCVTERLGREPARLPAAKCRDETCVDAGARTTFGNLKLVHSA